MARKRAATGDPADHSPPYGTLDHAPAPERIPAMLTTTERTNTVSPTPPSQPRLSLTATRVGQAVLDGGWWPRSWDPVDELPGLVLALADRYGRIWQVMLNSTA